jgi:hypothetical protein
MKIGGIDPKTLPNVEFLVIPRGDKQIVFHAQGLADLDEFHKMVPEPKAPVAQTPNGIVANTKDAGYLSSVAEYSKRRVGYLVVHSLKPSDIEWDTVNLDSPGTWTNWEQDLKNAGLTQVECNLVFNLVWGANSLDEAKLKQARETFLRGTAPALAS